MGDLSLRSFRPPVPVPDPPPWRSSVRFPPGLRPGSLRSPARIDIRQPRPARGSHTKPSLPGWAFLSLPPSAPVPQPPAQSRRSEPFGLARAACFERLTSYPPAAVLTNANPQRLAITSCSPAVFPLHIPTSLMLQNANHCVTAFCMNRVPTRGGTRFQESTDCQLVTRHVFEGRKGPLKVLKILPGAATRNGASRFVRRAVCLPCKWDYTKKSDKLQRFGKK